MPKLSEIIDILETNMPFSLKEEWDNIGLMIGDTDSEISSVLIALDCTQSVVSEAIEKKVDLIITHHPLIFGGVSNVDFKTPLGRKIKEIIKNDINVVSCHTNFDKAPGGTSDTVAKLLNLENVENLTSDEYSLGKTGVIKPVTLKEFVGIVKEKLNVSAVKYVGCDEKIIKKVAIVSGSGSEFYKDALNTGSDVLITSEIKHHIAIEGQELGLALVDAGHFETENISLGTFVKILSDRGIKAELSEKYNKLFKTV